MDPKRINFLTDEKISVVTQYLLHNTLDNLPGKKIADLGAGDCRIAIRLAEEGFEVTAVEQDVRLSRGKIRRSEALQNLGTLKIIEAKIENYFNSKKFDAALLFGVLHYTNNIEEARLLLKHVISLLKPGSVIAIGWLLNTMPARVGVFYPQEADVKNILKEEGVYTELFWKERVLHNDLHGKHVHEVAHCLGVKG